MKKMKKIFALLIAMVMVLGVGTSVFAASIEIKHDSTYEGSTGTTARVYLAYKIFDASYDELAGENTQAAKDTFVYDPTDAAVAYSMDKNNPWVPVMLDDEQEWFDVLEDGNGNYVVTPKDGAYTTSAHALAFAEYLQDHIPTTATSKEVTVDAAAVTVDPGYYLIVAKDEKDGATKIALVTTDVEMIEKNSYITTNKTAREAAYQIGDKVEYTATVTIPADTALTEKEGEGYKSGHGPITLHDEMDSTLTFAGTMKTAKVDGTDFTGYTLVWTQNNTAVNHTTNQTDGCTFEVVIPVTAELLGKTITFTYEAEVNSSAAGEDGLVNTLKGDVNGYNTNPDSPVVYTFDFSFKKVFDGSTDKDLTATFVLQDEDDTVIPLTKIDATHYAVKDSDDQAVTDNLITITNGQEINIKGLKDSTYKLVEKSTSTGYNLLDSPVTIVITDETSNDVIARSITVDGKKLGDGVYTFDVENFSGSVLPSTGGIGTTIFYIVGAILVVGAAVLLVTRRRVNAK